MIKDCNFDKKILFLFIVPVIMVVLYILLFNAKGYYYYGYNSDPEYAYLLNSLSIVNGLTPGHTDHPGTTLQMLGAAVIKLANLSKSNDEINTIVISNPEHYLNLINITMFIIFICTTITLGVIGYLFLNDILLAVILQLSSFVSFTAFRELSRVTPETLLLSICTIFLIILLFHFKYDIEKHSFIYSIIFGVVCGIGLVTKVTFLPLFIVPLVILPNLKNRLLFLLSTLLAFFIFTIPVISEYERIFNWFISIFTHSGYYGGGEKNIINFHTIFNNLFMLISEYTYLIINFAAGLSLIFIFFKNKTVIKKKDNQFLFKLIIALLCATVLQILMTLKHYRHHYLIPTMMLTIFTLVLAYIFLTRNKISPFEIKNDFFYYFILVIFSIFMIYFIKEIKSDNMINRETNKLKLFLSNNYSDYTKVYYYRSSSLEFSLLFYDKDFNRGHFIEYIKKIYHNDKILFYNVWGEYYYNFDYIFKRLPNPEKSIFIGTNEIENSVSSEYKNRLRRVFKTKLENSEVNNTNVYEIMK